MQDMLKDNIDKTVKSQTCQNISTNTLCHDFYFSSEKAPNLSFSYRKTLNSVNILKHFCKLKHAEHDAFKHFIGLYLNSLHN